MIDLSQEEIFRLIWRSFSSGIILGIIYECIRFIKLICGIQYLNNNCDKGKRVVGRFFRHGITFLFDVIFCILVSLVSIILIYHVSGGVFRGIIYISMLIGLLLYYFTLGKLLLRLNIKFSKFVRRSISWLARIIIIPFKFICSLIIKLYHLTIKKFIDKIIEDIKNKVAQKNSVDALQQEKLLEEDAKEDRSINEKNRYRKKNRISFGAPKHQSGQHG